jgi:hypothetical protein
MIFISLKANIKFPIIFIKMKGGIKYEEGK